MTAGLAEVYRDRYERVLRPIAERLQELLLDHFDGAKHIDRISARAKTPDRFLAKAAKLDADGRPKYVDPLVQIQDQIGARIIVYYRIDVAPTEEIARRYLHPIELVTIVPDSVWEFGYFGRHSIMALPKDAIPDHLKAEEAPAFFELQLKTLFQHAWSEAEHDLGYKPVDQLTPEQKRLLAYTSAQAWGADDVFERLALELAPGR